MDSSSEQVEMRIRRRQSVAVAVALAASVAMHILILLLLVSLAPRFGWNATPRPEVVARHPQIRLQQVITQPPPIPVRPPRFRPENPDLTVELPAEAGRASEGIDEGVIESRLPPGRQLAAESEPVREPASPPVRPTWQPRQEILMIENKVVESPLSVKPRSYRPVVVRVRKAADLVYAATPDEALQDAMNTPSDPAGDLDVEHLDLQNPAEGWGGTPGKRGARRAPPLAVMAPTQETARVVEEPPDKVSPWKHLEKLLKVEVETYAPLREPFGYARILIERIGEEELPTLPKDLLLVQDCSASITEQRMNFCREGLLRCLPMLQPQDRFNVVGFRDRVDRCFADWAAPTPEALEKAAGFIRAMKSEGDTDIYDSLRSFMEDQRVPGRPTIVFVVSDGVPTVGITDSSRIIGQFSRINRGAISVFTMGTYGGANTYLLDLLSYRNRGDTYVVTSGRWDLPTAIETRVRSFARPLLADLAVVFSAAHDCEGFPAMPSNLYLDRPLELFCRYPKNLDLLVFQVTGRAGTTECDMVFMLELGKAKAGKENIRTAWAWQKVYQLISEHTRTQSSATLRELRQVGNTYGLRIPYKEELLPASPAP